MKRKGNIVVGFAVSGFLVGVALAIFAFFPMAHNHESLYILLCPPSLGLLVDPKTLLSAIIIWLMICCANAALYAIPGILIQLAVDKSKSSD